MNTEAIVATLNRIAELHDEPWRRQHEEVITASFLFNGGLVRVRAEIFQSLGHGPWRMNLVTTYRYYRKKHPGWLWRVMLTPSHIRPLPLGYKLPDYRKVAQQRRLIANGDLGLGKVANGPFKGPSSGEGGLATNAT